MNGAERCHAPGDRKFLVPSARGRVKQNVDNRSIRCDSIVTWRGSCRSTLAPRMMQIRCAAVEGNCLIHFGFHDDTPTIERTIVWNN